MYFIDAHVAFELMAQYLYELPCSYLSLLCRYTLTYMAWTEWTMWRHDWHNTDIWVSKASDAMPGVAVASEATFSCV